MTDKLKLTKKIYLPADIRASFNTLVLGSDDSGVVEESLRQVADAGDEFWRAFGGSVDADCSAWHYSRSTGDTDVNLDDFFTKSFEGKVLFINLLEEASEERRRMMGGHLGNIWDEGAAAPRQDQGRMVRGENDAHSLHSAPHRAVRSPCPTHPPRFARKVGTL